MFAVFNRAISCRSSCTLWRNCSIVVATVRFYKRGVRSVHKTEHLSAAFGSVAPKTPRYRENQGQPLVGAWLIGTTKSVPVTRPAKMTMLCPVLRRADRYTIPEKSPYPFEIQYPIDCRRAGTALGWSGSSSHSLPISLSVSPTCLRVFAQRRSSTSRVLPEQRTSTDLTIRDPDRQAFGNS
jgi:hypothetical protein